MSISMKTRVLIAAHPTVGHVTALTTIGRRLRADGADVRFAIVSMRAPDLPLLEAIKTAQRLPRAIEAAGLRVVPLPLHPSLLAYAVVMPRTAGAVEVWLAGRAMTSGAAGYVRSLEAELDREPADVIVADFAFVAAGLVAERRGVPFVSFYHSGLPFPAGGEHPFTNGAALSRAVDARVGRVRKALGMPPARPGLLDRPCSPDLNLLAAAPALEGRALEYGPTTRCVGPCVDGRVEDDASTFPFDRLRPEASKVYVSLGTVFNGRPDRFRALIEGLRAPGVQLVVSAGGSFSALAGMAGPDVMVFHRVPQLAVLRGVDYVVSHGGNNTVNEALSAGRPLLVLPIGGEQEANAERVVRVGAGMALDRRRLSPSHVRAAFNALCTDARYGRRAREIAEELKDLRGAEEAARLIAALALERQGATSRG